MTPRAAPLTLVQADPKGLVRESYRIDGITEGECRSIFLDWALSLAPGTDPGAAMERLLEEYGAAQAHPMSAILREGRAMDAAPAHRRGGRAGRLRGQ
ncbi:hypothetical protein [Alkalilacustris brevis]|uniref:hypothetical protein n=1 Tax=Alkalilacustris brevis TaxID=2026338 RepID=UPI000E0D39E3|nr:hypothetical protein [Alkalilacustris brevis]